MCRSWLFGLVLAYHAVAAASLSIFLIGDSVDRFTVHDWCEYHGWRQKTKAVEEDWGDESLLLHELPRDHDKIPFLLCRSPANDSIAFVHIYGSSPEPPYLKVYKCSTPTCPTPARIQRALELYYQKVGPPDMIILHTIQWDAQKFLRRGSDYSTITEPVFNATLRDFQSYTNGHLDAIFNTSLRLSRVASACPPELALRTAIANEAGTLLVASMNEVYRGIAQMRNITLWDVDNDVWSALGWRRHDAAAHSVIFRDYIHANPYFLAAAGEKMLRNRYSSYFIERRQHNDCPTRRPPKPPRFGSSSSSSPQPLPGARVQTVHLIAATDDPRTVFYFAPPGFGVRRWGNASQGFQEQLFLGAADVYLLPKADLETIPVVGNISAPELWDGQREGLLQTTPSKNIVLLESQKCEVLSWPSVFKTMRCVTVLPKQQPNTTKSLDNLRVVDEALLALFPACPPSKPDRWYGADS